jgi:sugar-specific transcriptional regulator TrmB
MKGVGFSRNESLIYLAALGLGPSTVWEIAKKSGVKRPTCYVILEELSIRGLASSTNDGKRVVYSVVSAHQFIKNYARQYERLTKVESELAALAVPSNQKPYIQFYDGFEGIKTVYNMILDEPSGSEYLLYGFSLRSSEELREYLGTFISERISKRIKTRAIFSDTEYNVGFTERDSKELRETRLLPEVEFHQKTQTNIFGDSVAYVAQSAKQPFATVITSPDLAHDERQRFELLWKISKPSS